MLIKQRDDLFKLKTLRMIGYFTNRAFVEDLQSSVLVGSFATISLDFPNDGDRTIGTFIIDEMMIISSNKD